MATKNTLPFEPTRSLIYLDCANEEYRVKIEHYLYNTHVPESISLFGPYVTKYAFYPALPAPEGSERYGVQRMQLTEHYWMCCPDNEKFFPHNKALGETFPPEMMYWGGVLPKMDMNMATFDVDDTRQGGGTESSEAMFNIKPLKPLIFAFIPVWWEDDIKGAGRTIAAGPNYRWQFAFRYPDDAKEEGEKWLMNEVLPAFAECDETTRILSSRIIKEVNDCPFDRVVEIWFEGPNEWKSAVNKVAEKATKPEWAQTEDFPYVEKLWNIQSIFLSDIARSDNLTQYHGYITMR